MSFGNIIMQYQCVPFCVVEYYLDMTHADLLSERWSAVRCVQCALHFSSTDLPL